MGEENINLELNDSKLKNLTAFPKILLGILIGLVLGTTITTIFTKSTTRTDLPKQSNAIENNIKLEDKKSTENTNNNLISKHYLTTDTKIYENTRLGYKVDYPRGISQVYDCPDIPCASIEDFTIRMEPLRFYGGEEILNDDLYCSADGPQGSARCERPQISEYTNALGVKGFSVKRLRIVESREFEGYKVVDTKTEQFNDIVYVFPIMGNLTYKAILLATDTPDEKNLGELEKIANSFRLTN